MFDRSTRGQHAGTIAAGAVFLVLAGVLSAPAVASTTSRFPCSEVPEANLNVPVIALTTEVVGHNIPVTSPISDTASKITATTSVLAPRARAAIREAFEDNDETAGDSSTATLTKTTLTPPMVGTGSKGEKPGSSMHTRLPGVSDDAMLRYKKKMFRRDI